MARLDKFKLFLLSYFLVSVYFFLLSDSGYLERLKLKEKFNNLKVEILNTGVENKKIIERINDYKSGKIKDPDLLRSGFTKSDSLAVIFEKTDIPTNSSKTNKENGFISLNLSILKMIWLLLSAYLIYMFVIKRNNRNGEKIE